MSIAFHLNLIDREVIVNEQVVGKIINAELVEAKPIGLFFIYDN